MGGGNFANTKLAIVVPVYNTERYLAECLDSIRSQDYSNYVVFIVDDGSTDNSLSIANRFARESLNCIVMHKENGGVSSARNVALDMIEEDGSFDVVCFLDSDDVAAANSFNTIANAFSKYQADYITFSFILQACFFHVVIFIVSGDPQRNSVSCTFLSSAHAMPVPGRKFSFYPDNLRRILFPLSYFPDLTSPPM